MSAARSRPVGASKPRRKKVDAATTEHSADAGPRSRSPSYRGPTPAAAAEAYHADALVMARMGYAPTAEQWSSEMQQVLVVEYIHAPEKAPAVLEALVKAKGDPVLESPPADPRTSRVGRLRFSMPLEAKIAAGALGGMATGIALCLVLGAIASEAPDAITLIAFGIIGLV